jgi:hypothetical protein
MKDKIDDLVSNSKNRNSREFYRSINEFKKCYQPRNNLLKDDSGDLLADHKILDGWKNYCRQLLAVHGAGDARQTAEPFGQILAPVRVKLLEV